ncbi:MAG: hypothetical protein HQ534_03870 [Armatimonadetes bacterium]|nr:hypothetical protein [Armatimonadota bacterium]
MKKSFFIILILIPILSFSQSLEYKLDKPNNLFIGTPFHILVEIASDPEDSIFTPEIDTLNVFILKNVVSSETMSDDIKTTYLDFTFQTFDTGEFTFPELEFAVKSNDSLSFLRTSAFILNVKSVISDTTQTIKDIAKPVSVNFGFFDFFVPIIIIFILIVIIIYLRKILRKKPEQQTEQEFIDKRPTYIIALEMLNNLKKRELLKTGEFLIFYFHLSYITRFFIERYYQINAVEMTTSEIREKLQLDNFKEKSKIMNFLNFADKVKFAKFIPTLKESGNSFDWLGNYLKSFESISNKQNKQDEQKRVPK